MNHWGAVLFAVLVGLAVNETSDMCSWMAAQLARWAARTWCDDEDLGMEYAEEWAAVVEERPGKLLKLFTAIGFALAAVVATERRAVGRRGQPAILLRLFVGAVAVCAIGSVGVVVVASGQPAWPGASSAVGMVSLTLLVAVAASTYLRAGQAPAEYRVNLVIFAVLIGVMTSPGYAVLVCTVVGSVLAYCLQRRPLIKAVFNTAKNALMTVAALAVVAFVEASLYVRSNAGLMALATIAAWAAMIVVEQILLVPVLSLAGQTTIRTTVSHVQRNARVDVLLDLFQLVAAFVALMVLREQPRTVAALPLVLLAVRLSRILWWRLRRVLPLDRYPV